MSEKLLLGRNIPFEDIQNATLSSLTERELVEEVGKLKEKFLSRKNLHHYPETPESVTAYTLLYASTNMVKWWQLLSWLPESTRESLGARPFIDMGSGPGAFSLAQQIFSETQQQSFYLCDQSSLMLDQAKKLCQKQSAHYLSPNELKAKSKDIDSPVLVFGHSLNEMGKGEALKWVEKLNPETVIIIEPGTRECFTEVLEFREGMLKKDYSIQFPCLKPTACPIQKNTKEWCHQVVRTTFPDALERLCQLSELDRKIQPMIAHVYTNQEIKTSKLLKAYFYRFLRETKHSFEWQVCLSPRENGPLQLKVFEIPKKTLSKAAIKTLKQASTGGHYTFELIKKISEDHWRTKFH